MCKLFVFYSINEPLVKSYLIACLLFAFLADHMGQDTLYLPNGNTIEGEIKGMQNNLLTIDTEYGDKDFIIKWDQIKRVYSTTYFYVSMSNGTSQFGWLSSISDSTIGILNTSGMIDSCDQVDIFRLREINKGFANRFSAGFDMGMGLAKANNMKKLTANAKVGYRAEKWIGQAYASALSSSQDNTEPIRRIEGHTDFRYIFYKGWALDPSINFLSNTEQNLELRSILKLGINKYILRKRHGYWGVGAGGNRNMEQFSNDTPDRNSWEGYFETEVRLFDVKDLELFTKTTAYPSFTESGRWRIDFNFNITYDLPLDFYVNLDWTVNFDNQPAEGASETDYVFQLGLGWSW